MTLAQAEQTNWLRCYAIDKIDTCGCVNHAHAAIGVKDN
jgi:hypothetical protein